MQSALVDAVIPSPSDHVKWSTPLRPSPNLAEASVIYEERGAALFVPESGGIFEHTGPDALDLLHRLTTNSVIDLADGSARRTILSNERGRIVDVFWVLKRSDGNLLLVTDSTDPSRMRDWIDRFTIIEDAKIANVSDLLLRRYVVGPNASAVLSEAFPELDFMHCDVGYLQWINMREGGVVFILRTDAAGQESWAIIGEGPVVPEIDARFDTIDMPFLPNLLFDCIRVRNKSPIADYELTERVNPLEAGLMDFIDFNKGCYIGQEVIARLNTYDKVQRTLVGFSQVGSTKDAKMVGLGDSVLLYDGQRRVGWVTSIALDPRTNHLIGLAYVRKAHSKSGSVLTTAEGPKIKIVSPVI